MGRPGRQKRDADTPFSLDDDAPGLRVQRLTHIVFEELDRLFRFEVSDPRLSEVTLARVELSPDLRNAKVYYALRRPGNAESQRGVQEGLFRVTPFLRARLADAMVIKRLPDLHFHRDRLAESSLRATRLLGASAPTRSSAE